MNAATSPDQQVRSLRILCLIILAAMGFGLWLQLPYLTFEHRRLESWKIAGLWAGDVTALFWFVRFVFVHAGLGEPLSPVPLADGKHRVKFVTTAILLATLIDLSFTLFLIREAKEGYARGQPVTAQITRVSVHEYAATTFYELESSFNDAYGRPQVAMLRVEAKQHVIPPALSPETVRALRERTSGPIRIRYDPTFPARAWVDGQGWDDGNAIYWFSLLTLFFQSMIAALFLLQLRKHTAGGYLPWWWDVYKALPLAAETFWMVIMGLISRLMDSL